MLTVVHISYIKSLKDGGIYTYILNLQKNLLKNNINSFWITTKNKNIRHFHSCFFDSIKELNPDIIHIHGLWRKPTRIIKDLSKISKNIIVSPHGMFNKELFNQSKFKKQISMFLFEKRNLKIIKFFHSLNEYESKSINYFFPYKPSEIISSGIVMPNKYESKNFCNTDLKKLFNNKKIVLYLGRLVSRKGINELIEAWLNLNKNSYTSEWLLVFAGFGPLSKLLKKLNQEKSNRILFIGEVYGKEKDYLLSCATGFILPSNGEGTPISALEALSYKTVCLLTEKCNLEKLSAQNIAYKIEKDPKSIEKNLKLLFKLSDQEISYKKEMGVNYIEKEHNWELTTKKMINLYKKVIENARKEI